MDRASIYRLMAVKWLETAEQVENRALKRCYAKRALVYQAMAKASRPDDTRPPPAVVEHFSKRWLA